jgi:hypothetical protein
MGSVVAFPQVRRPVKESQKHGPPEGAIVIILPTVRVERPDGAPSETPKSPTGGKRRRRASRI